MGFIADHTTGPPPFSCHDLYKWLLRLNPGFDTNDDTISKIIADEEPDIELWQYMGRRFFPPPPPDNAWVRNPRTTVDYSPPRNGRVRGIAIIRAQYSFATQALRDRVVGRLTTEGYKVTDQWREPT